MHNCGQADTVRTAIRFANIDAAGSYVKNSVVRNSFNRGYMLQAVRNAVFDNNVVFDTIGSNGFFQLCQNITITNNLHMLVRPTPVEGTEDQVQIRFNLFLTCVAKEIWRKIPVDCQL